ARIRSQNTVRRTAPGYRPPRLRAAEEQQGNNCELLLRMSQALRGRSPASTSRTAWEPGMTLREESGNAPPTGSETGGQPTELPAQQQELPGQQQEPSGQSPEPAAQPPEAVLPVPPPREAPSLLEVPAPREAPSPLEVPAPR